VSTTFDRPFVDAVYIDVDKPAPAPLIQPVIAQQNLGAGCVPRRGDFVYVGGARYAVHELRWLVERGVVHVLLRRQP